MRAPRIAGVIDNKIEKRMSTAEAQRTSPSKTFPGFINQTQSLAFLCVSVVNEFLSYEYISPKGGGAFEPLPPECDR
jgi:hypothetical protein